MSYEQNQEYSTMTLNTRYVSRAYCSINGTKLTNFSHKHPIQEEFPKNKVNFLLPEGQSIQDKQNLANPTVPNSVVSIS